jgi:Protein of unknown function (DUF2924)
MPAAQALEAELARIAALGLDEVRALWREMTQQNAPKALSRDLLARMIAYRVQEQRFGKLGREMRKLLDRLAREGAGPVRHLKIGTVMVREHQGTLHEVMVVPGGFCWQEKTYPSLSTIPKPSPARPGMDPASSACGEEAAPRQRSSLFPS